MTLSIPRIPIGLQHLDGGVQGTAAELDDATRLDARPARAGPSAFTRLFATDGELHTPWRICNSRFDHNSATSASDPPAELLYQGFRGRLL